MTIENADSALNISIMEEDSLKDAISMLMREFGFSYEYSWHFIKNKWEEKQLQLYKNIKNEDTHIFEDISFSFLEPHDEELKWIYMTSPN